ncbi:MAG: glycosyltransferase family 117 protein [Anaerolineae bacterium]
MKTEHFVAMGYKTWNRIGDGMLGALSFLLSLLLYLHTLAPSVAALFDDSLEFPLVCFRLAIAHPTGYPLYTLLGKLFTLGPWRNVAWSVNLLSAVAGALTVALVYLTARQLTRHRLPALLGTMGLAISPVFWSQAVVAEVYTLNAAFVTGLLWLALRWAQRPLIPVEPFSLLLVAPAQRSMLFLPGRGFGSRLPSIARRTFWRGYRSYRRFFPSVPPRRRLRLNPLSYGLAALLGLALTHHRTIVLLAPALLLFALLIEPRTFSRAAMLGPEHYHRPRWLQILSRPAVLLGLSFLSPLLLYLYLPLRGDVGSLDGTYVNTWRGFWQWVMAGSYSLFLGKNPLARRLDAAFYVELFWQQFGPVGLAVALVGLFALFRRPQALALASLAFLAYTAFAVVYRVPDVEVFFIPTFLIVSLWVAVGLDHAKDLLRPRGPSLALRRLLAMACLILFLVAFLQPLWIALDHYPELDLSRHWIVRDFGWYLLSQPLPTNSTVVGLLGEMTLLRYLQETTGLRRDVETVARDDEETRREAVERALAEGRSVYITRPLPGLADRYSLGSVIGLIDVNGDLETLIHVGKPGSEVPSIPRPTDLELIPGLRLVGYGLYEHRGHWQAWVRLRLWWQALPGRVKSFKVSARLVDADGQLVAVTDAEPVAGTYPPTAWRPDEVVADAYEIPLPAGLPPGDYTPVVIVYEPTTGIERGRVTLASVWLTGNPARPPRRALEAGLARTVYARFKNVELLGYVPPDPRTIYYPGDLLPVTLLWQARGEPAEGMQVAFWLQGVQEHPVDQEPLGGRFPTDRWSANQVVQQKPSLLIPGSVPAGAYRLKMRVMGAGRPVAWGRGWIPLGSDLDLGTVQIGR